MLLDLGGDRLRNAPRSFGSSGAAADSTADISSLSSVIIAVTLGLGCGKQMPNVSRSRVGGR